MLERVKRAMMPMGPSASVIAGNTHCLGSPHPPVGKIGSTKENRMIRNTASTKFGTLTPSVATVTDA